MYALVCSEKTSCQWPDALSKLEGKYEAVWPGRVRTVLYKSDQPSQGGGHHAVRHSLGQLSILRPHYCCFLAHHSECSKLFVQEVNRMTRELDISHPYTDTVWGILTGFVEEDVTSALEQKPLLIRRVVANCPVDLEKFRSGVWFSESEQGCSYRKVSRESKVIKEKCPDDTTEVIACEISDERRLCDKNNYYERGVDMIITSGHATEKDWNIAYCFKGGKFQCSKGQLYGSTLAGKNIDLHRSQNPKVLSAAGNCLMGHISDENCMALGWMHSANIVQMIGYVEPTWFGYGGWGVHKYFVNNPGSLSLAESFFANQQSLLHELHSKFSVEEVETQIGNYRSVYDMCFNTSSSGERGVSRECCGLIYDRDNVAFYGDPAWRAEMESNPEVYDYTCSLEEVSPPSPTLDTSVWQFWRFTALVLRSGWWNSHSPDDKGTCPGRPPVYLFPQRLSCPVVVTGEAVVTERFLLLPLTGECTAGEQHCVVFKSKKTDP